MVPILSCEGFCSCLWNSLEGLITNYAQQEHVEEALKRFISMSCEGLSLEATTFVVKSLECVYRMTFRLVD